MMLFVLKMSLLICFNNKDPHPWSNILKERLPNVDIEIYPSVKDKLKVTFVLCWKPDKNVLEQFPNLKVIQSVGASIDHITTSQNLNDNFAVSRIVDHHLSEDMYEFVLASILSHIKDFPAYNQDKAQKIWKQKPYKTISNSTIGLLGTGKIGAHVAAKLAQIGFTVKAWSRSEKNITQVSTFYGETGLTATLQDTDILINILPLTEETTDILNYQTLSQLNPNAYLINVGRGEHLVEADLIKLLDQGHLSGALLDVFRTEPLPVGHPFWAHKKIRITPHVAAITRLDSASDLVAANYQRMMEGQDLLNLVSIEKVISTHSN